MSSHGNSQSLGQICPILRVAFPKDSELSFLIHSIGIGNMPSQVLNQISSCLRTHNLSVQSPWLSKITIGVSRLEPHDPSSNCQSTFMGSFGNGEGIGGVGLVIGGFKFVIVHD